MSSIIPCFSIESLRIDHSCFSFFWKGWWFCWPFLYWVCGPLLKGRAPFFCWKKAPFVALALLLVERLLLIACRLARSLLLGDLDEVEPRLLPLDRLQEKIGNFNFSSTLFSRSLSALTVSLAPSAYTKFWEKVWGHEGCCLWNYPLQPVLPLTSCELPFLWNSLPLSRKKSWKEKNKRQS